MKTRLLVTLLFIEVASGLTAIAQRTNTNAPSQNAPVTNKDPIEISFLWTTNSPTSAGMSAHTFNWTRPLGLTDLDFGIYDWNRDWGLMQCPDDTTAANLVVKPHATVQELENAIELLNKKGHYNRVIVLIDHSSPK